MYRIPRPSEPGVYDLDILNGDRIETLTFSNTGIDCFNILTTTGKLFIISLSDNGELMAGMIDLNTDNLTAH